jgi:hypothetical protein
LFFWTGFAQSRYSGITFTSIRADVFFLSGGVGQLKEYQVVAYNLLLVYVEITIPIRLSGNRQL